MDNAKVFVQLRNPVRRFLSLYKHHFKHHKQASINQYAKKAISNFKKGLVAERFVQPHHNLNQSFYSEAIARNQKLFGDHFYVSLFDETVTRPEEFAESFSEWLEIEVDPFKDIFLDSTRVNQSTPVKGSGSVSAEVREELQALFKDDLAKTSELLKRDLAQDLRL